MKYSCITFNGKVLYYEETSIKFHDYSSTIDLPADQNRLLGPSILHW